ncbi:MAG: metallophosphoesterase [Smithellaceae bacterium]|nr:metallophosphoesterase [Smithellaceae bacterium]
MKIDRRDFLKLAGIGGVVFASALTGIDRWAYGATSKARDFYFLQMSDSHWGFQGTAVNPDAAGTLKKAVAAVNGLRWKPDFIMFTGDLTHTTDDDKERRKRLAEFKGIVSALKVKNVHFMPGEHDAGLDEGAAFREAFGKTHYTFDHKGIHFIVVDNVSDPTSSIGDAQLQWLDTDLKKQRKDTPIVVFTHRPLFDLYPDWDWHTRDGAKAIDLLTPYTNVVVLYGHIHQRNDFMTGHIAHHAAQGLMYPLPAPGSQPKKAPVPWDPANPYRGLGFREVKAAVKNVQYAIAEYNVMGAKI